MGKKLKKKLPGAGLNGRPHPPENLGVEEATLWVDVVNARPPDYFGKETQALLEEYVRYVVQGRWLGRMVMDQMEEVDDGGVVDSKALKRLIAMQTQTTAKMMALARSMRLTHQSIYLPDSSAGKGKPKDLEEKPWEYTGHRRLKPVK